MTDEAVQSLAALDLHDAALVVCYWHGTSKGELMRQVPGGGLARSGGLPELRRQVWTTLRSVRQCGVPKWSYPEIGHCFRVNHTTVITSVQRAEPCTRSTNGNGSTTTTNTCGPQTA